MKTGNEKGMVLLLVLVVVALLSALLSDFAFSTLVDLRLTETFRDTTKAEYLSRGGITAGRMILQTDRNSYDARNDPNELWSIGVQDYPLAEGAVSVKIDDLNGRLPLNKLVDLQGNSISVYRDRFVRLCQELALDNPDALADSLTDWLDPDNTPEPDGAEDAYYLSLNPPYEATDGPLRSIDEMRLIRGFDVETVELLSPFVSSFGDGKLNINTASPEMLLIWDIDMTTAIVEDIQSWRDDKPFKNPVADLISAIGQVDASALNRNGDLAVKSSYYLISSQGRVNDGTRRMQAIVNKTNDQLLWQKVN
jgi:general secretion pathway protein K